MIVKHPILVAVDELLLKGGDTANKVLNHSQKVQKAFHNQSGDASKDRWAAVYDQLCAITTLMSAVREEAKAAMQLDIQAFKEFKETKK